VTFEGTSIESVAKKNLCRRFIKVVHKCGYDYIIRFSKGGLENKQPKLVKLGYPMMLIVRGKCWSQHVAPHRKKWGDHLVGNE
jgi:hypothetical protein